MVISKRIKSLFTILLFLVLHETNGQQLKVMTFNIWHGGRETGLEDGPRRVVDIIRDSGTDIVAMQETYGSGERIANELGYHFYLRSSNLSILSRYPIIDTLDAYDPFHSGAVTINVLGKHFVVACNWLNYPFDYWDMLEKGKAIDSLEWRQQFDGEKNAGILRGILDRLSPAIENSAKVPVIVCGDFNSGSHLDWIPETRHFNSGYVMPFPSTLLMETKGFRDAFRQVYSNALTHRGTTWTPINPAAHQDRIDYIFYQGDSLWPIDARVITKHPEIYPSDHGAVLVTFMFK